MTEASVTIIQRILVLFLACFFGLVISWIACKNGYYKLCKTNERKGISFHFVLLAFGIFLFIQIALVPFLYMFWLYLEKGVDVNLKDLHVDVIRQGWINLGSIGLLAIALFVFYTNLSNAQRLVVWGDEKLGGKKISHFFIALLTWFIAYPWIIVVGQIVQIGFQIIYSITPEIDQVAVRKLKELMKDPPLLIITSFTIVLVVPFIEELLFRGFLQSWCKRFLSVRGAIIATSIVFSLFHFSFSQGVENIELLLALFILSCYLGFLRERQNSLWASISLHGIFNFVSILMILSTSYQNFSKNVSDDYHFFQAKLITQEVCWKKKLIFDKMLKNYRKN